MTGEQAGKDWISYGSFVLDTSGSGPLPPGYDIPDMVPVASHTSFDSFQGPPQMVLRIPAPKAGIYTILVDGMTGPQAAMLQLRVNDEPVGQALDFYAPTRGRSGLRKLADIPLSEGENLLYLTLPGKSPKSTGAQVDLISLQGKRVR